MTTAHDLRKIASEALTTAKYIETLIGKAKEQAMMGSYSVNLTIPASIDDAEVKTVSEYLNKELGYKARQVSYKGYRMLNLSWR